MISCPVTQHRNASANSRDLCAALQIPQVALASAVEVTQVALASTLAVPAQQPAGHARWERAERRESAAGHCLLGREGGDNARGGGSC